MTEGYGLLERLAFLQRSGEHLPALADVACSPAPLTRVQFQITGVLRKQTYDDSERSYVDPKTWTPPTVPLLSALHASATPLCYRIRMHHGKLELLIGSWSAQAESASETAPRIAHLVNATDIHVDVGHPHPPGKWPRAAGAAFLLGMPTPLAPSASDPSGVIDRLLRVAYRFDWELTVLASPVAESDTVTVRDSALRELRDVYEAMDAKRIALPVGEHFRKVVDAYVDHLNVGVRTGCWRTAAYITVFGDNPGAYFTVVGALRGLLNGDRSLPEPIRITADPGASDFASRWVMADLAGARGPGILRRPYQYQTLLNSEQLAAYINLPELETPGFSVRPFARFETETVNPVSERAVSLGAILTSYDDSPTAPTGATRPDFRIELDDLTRHAFVPGMTGSGKTNTILKLITSLPATVPFMVLEPAKTEYRVLVTARSDTRVFTVARESVTPLRMNPFEVLPLHSGQYDVAGHIDRLRSLFVACFGLWNPLPAVLERSLYQIYSDRGWDLRTGTNPRLSPTDDRRLSFPTLTNLAYTVDDVIDDLGYNQEIADNLRGALSVRVNALRLGAKGRMLDTPVSTPAAELFNRPVVVELEGLGEESDKAFLMGLLLVQLAAYRRSVGPRAELSHLLVVEEAHRLLRNVSRSANQEDDNSAAAAVESFGNLLAEVRAYGQGIVIADQIPTDLSPVVIKNTNLKIAHRLVADDDRQAVGTSMVMNNTQLQRLATLSKGQAAVFKDGQDGPMLVQIDRVPMHTDTRVSDETLAADAPPPPSDCPGHVQLAGVCCPYADALLSRPEFPAAYSRLAVAAINGGPIQWESVDVADLLAAETTPGVQLDAFASCTLGRAALWFAQRRGAQYGWSYATVSRLTESLRTAFNDANASPSPEQLRDFQPVALRLHHRANDPFPNCFRICPDQTCVFRGSVLDALQSSPSLQDTWNSAASIADDQERLQAYWDTAYPVGAAIAGRDAGYPVRPNRASAGIRAALCYAQHVERVTYQRPPSSQRDIVAALVDQYGVPAPEPTAALA